jgi:N-acetylmuramoyl-L-alanine amidase
MIVLIDNGHGSDTPGKCSPDRMLKEYLKSREIARELVKALNGRLTNVDAVLLVPEDRDISLPERCRRANAYCDKYGKDNVLLVSIHCNAAGADGKWKSAGGWCVYTSPGKTKADDLATEIWNAADKSLKDYKERFPLLQAQGAYDRRQKPMRADWSDGDPDYEARFYILVHTKCPAVLTESLFQDNKADCDFLLSEEGTNAIVELHADGIINYIKNQKK